MQFENHEIKVLDLLSFYKRETWTSLMKGVKGVVAAWTLPCKSYGSLVRFFFLQVNPLWNWVTMTCL